MEKNAKKNGKKKLSAEEKWRIYQEASMPGAQVGEILRKNGVYPAELARPNDEHAGLGNAIRQQRKENLKFARKERFGVLLRLQGKGKGAGVRQTAGNCIQLLRTLLTKSKKNSEEATCQNKRNRPAAQKSPAVLSNLLLV